MADREGLLFSVSRKDFEIEAFRGSGNGGQNRNKRDTACRIRHRASGAVATAQEHRTFDLNRKNAFLRLVASAKFKTWLAEMTKAAQGLPTIEERVEQAMCLENLKIEVREGGKWKKELVND